MARRAQFSTLITKLRDELGRSNSVAVGVSDVPRLKSAINSQYEALAEKYDWPFLRRRFTPVALAAGSRYYNLPTDLNFDRIEDCVVWFNGQSRQARRGITLNDYDTYNSDEDERSDPVLKWDIVDYNGSLMFEVWPLPASNDQTFQFMGFRKTSALVNDADLCLLDDWLVVKHAAVTLVKDNAVRALIAREATDRWNQLTANAAPDAPFRYGLGPRDEYEFRRPTIVVSG